MADKVSGYVPASCGASAAPRPPLHRPLTLPWSTIRYGWRPPPRLSSQSLPGVRLARGPDKSTGVRGGHHAWQRRPLRHQSPGVGLPRRPLPALPHGAVPSRVSSSSAATTLPGRAERGDPRPSSPVLPPSRWPTGTKSLHLAACRLHRWAHGSHTLHHWRARCSCALCDRRQRPASPRQQPHPRATSIRGRRPSALPSPLHTPVFPVASSALCGYLHGLLPPEGARHEGHDEIRRRAQQ